MRPPRSTLPAPRSFARLAAEVRGCRLCVEAPSGPRLPHAPRPVFRGLPTARLLIAGQAPGTKVHASGLPYDDASGTRLRAWLGLDPATFYDEAHTAIVPMGLCFPGQDAHGSDLPPRRECAPVWHARLMAAFPAIDLVVAVGAYAQRYHMTRLGLATLLAPTLTETVGNWRAIYAARARPRVIVLPHPSWRNTGWLKRNPWFDAELVPVLRRAVAEVLGRGLPSADRHPISAP